MDLLRPVREQAIRHVAEERVPSLSVAVYKDGAPLWIEAFGLADRERQLPATPATTYAVASASKPFTATAIAMLIASGRLSLDDPIGSRLRGIAPNVADVKLRELLQHQSGIPRHWRNVFAGQGAPPSFEQVARDHAFTTVARGRYLYSNLNYGLLGAVIGAETGDFQAHLRDAVFAPLGLNHVSFLHEHFTEWKAATPYEDDGTPIPPYLVDDTGARDLIMTAEDLARFGLGHLRNALGTASDLMAAERVEIDTTDVGRTSYGLGWIVEEDSPASLFTYGHTGEGPGAAASLSILPDEQLVVATVANAQGAPTYMLNEAIVDALSPRFAARRAAFPYSDPLPDARALRTLRGLWRGQMISPAGIEAVTLDLSSEMDATITVGEGLPSPLSRLGVNDGVLSGHADFSLRVPEAQNWPHQTRILLEKHGAALDGTITAYASRGPIAHEQFWLSYRLRLERQGL